MKNYFLVRMSLVTNRFLRLNASSYSLECEAPQAEALLEMARDLRRHSELSLFYR